MNEKKISIPLIIGGIVLIVTIGAGGIILSLVKPGSSNKNDNSIVSVTNKPSVDTSSSLSTTNFSSQSSVTNIVTYKDGSYESTGLYNAPSGDENLDVKITIINNTINDVTINPASNNPIALRYQEKFTKGISAQIVGKTLDKAYVNGNINGASLSGDGFNAALDKIKQQAKITL